jgi:SAM-dependent methyltransferase
MLSGMACAQGEHDSAPRRPRGSATVPLAGQSDDDVLERRRQEWNRRPLTREVYHRYFEAIGRELAPGLRTVEIGGGAGNLKSFRPDVRVSDIVATPYVDFVADALELPLADGAADNLILVDVLHHLPRPARFFREAARVLRPGGRVVMLEPYISLFSRVVFRLAHPEPVDLTADPLPVADVPVFHADGPFASNQAIPTLLFARDRARFEQRFPQLRVRTAQLDSVFVYPLSGGFSGPCMVPRFAYGAAWAVERVLSPLRRWLAFRLLVTLERVKGLNDGRTG